MYLSKQISITPVDTTKICGNFLTLDPKARYNLNVTAKIDSLKQILLRWSKRNLTQNGKMMIIKCHALSQLTFVNQFQNIKPADIKQIESICYKFIWNGGPEHVKRSTLKLNKLDGGIDGVDIDCFLQAIKIRQYFKAEEFCNPLSFIQRYCSMQEDISLRVRNTLSKLLKIVGKKWI